MTDLKDKNRKQLICPFCDGDKFIIGLDDDNIYCMTTNCEFTVDREKREYRYDVFFYLEDDRNE